MLLLRPDLPLSQWTPRTYAYRQLCAVVKREEPVCWICQCQIDPALKWPDPMSFSLDHLISPKLRPDLAEDRNNARASHLVHNQQRGMGRNVPAPRPVHFSVEDF